MFFSASQSSYFFLNSSIDFSSHLVLFPVTLHIADFILSTLALCHSLKVNHLTVSRKMYEFSLLVELLIVFQRGPLIFCWLIFCTWNCHIYLAIFCSRYLLAFNHITKQSSITSKFLLPFLSPLSFSTSKRKMKFQVLTWVFFCGSTAFLIGPKRQVTMMLDPVRIYATAIYIASIIIALFCAVYVSFLWWSFYLLILPLL